MYSVCPSSQEVETERTEVVDHPPLYSKFEASLGYTRPFLKRKKGEEMGEKGYEDEKDF